MFPTHRTMVASTASSTDSCTWPARPAVSNAPTGPVTDVGGVGRGLVVWCCQAGTGEEQQFELGHRQRRFEEVPLYLVTLVASQVRQLRCRLHAYGDHLQVEAVAHSYRRQGGGGGV